MIVIVFGLPGSGKSYFAKRVAQMLSATYIGSDAVRKDMFPFPSYTEEEKKEIYAEMMRRSTEAKYLKEVVVDATFSDFETREKFLGQAKKITDVYIIEIRADEDIIKQRLALPRQDSDADFEVYKKIKSAWQPLMEEHLVLRSTNDNIMEMLEKTFDYLFSEQMNQHNIQQLMNGKNFPAKTNLVELLETHISWVIVCDMFVYKIKKPVKYSFLDFSTLEKRKHYCQKEIFLNSRLTSDVYLDVLPVKKNDSQFFVDSATGEIIDYAVSMRKLPEARRMDRLLLNNRVSVSDVKSLAEKIASFHKQTNIIHKEKMNHIKELFNDILTQKDFLEANTNCCSLIANAIKLSDDFFELNESLLKKRNEDGFVRDCHGDLHSRNIFLLSEPIPFDCLEFNDDLRQIDILDEIAFLCMDLDAFGRHDLSDLFFNEYNKLFPAAITADEQKLFLYYKAYRANIRAKVNSLRAKDATNETEKKEALNNACKYLLLMDSYLENLAA